MDKIQFQHLPSPPITVNHGKQSRGQQVTNRPFATQLQTALGDQSKLTVSKHAQLRLEERAIQIDQNQWGQMEDKVREAKKMGITDSLVLLKDAAFIVSAQNNTVITAMNREEASSHIFTNINGTIVLD